MLKYEIGIGAIKKSREECCYENLEGKMTTINLKMMLWILFVAGGFSFATLLIGGLVYYSSIKGLFDGETVRIDLLAYLIRMSIMLLACMLIISMITIWYCRRYLLQPLFQAMCNTEDMVMSYVEEVKQKNHVISKMQRNIIFTLANMVENRDANTGGHIKRTAKYVKMIGNGLRRDGIYPEVISKQYVKKLYDSAPLHDIGKIKISDSILNKPGKLTGDEYEIVKTHTTEGEKILKSSLNDIEDDSWLTMAVEMAMYHHEKWDGTGYPAGLSGEEIPLCARIMAVADVFDALVSERSYKKPFSYEEAIRILTEGSGAQFDPLIISVFLHSENEIKGIMRAVK